MTHRLVSLHRIAAWSVAAALFVAPLEAAQTPVSTGPADQPANTVLLSPAAFAKLVRGPGASGAPVAMTQDPPRDTLLRQGTRAAAKAAALSPTPPRRSLGWGQKTIVVLACVGVIVGLLAATYYTGVDFMPLLNAGGGSR